MAAGVSSGDSLGRRAGTGHPRAVPEIAAAARSLVRAPQGQNRRNQLAAVGLVRWYR